MTIVTMMEFNNYTSSMLNFEGALLGLSFYCSDRAIIDQNLLPNLLGNFSEIVDKTHKNSHSFPLNFK